MAHKTSPVQSIWHGLQGTWQLRRTLHSANAEPSGKCTGTATFTSRKPAIFVDSAGKLQNASQEMLYSESGEFEMQGATNISSSETFPFSRKYIWRLQDDRSEQPEITIWFAKPGTEQIDYLFHKFTLQDMAETLDGDKTSTNVECTGDHLCVNDYYSSVYSFVLAGNSDSQSGHDASVVQSWNMLHEVRGPRKDQIIETSFTRS